MVDYLLAGGMMFCMLIINVGNTKVIKWREEEEGGTISLGLGILSLDSASGGRGA